MKDIIKEGLFSKKDPKEEIKKIDKEILRRKAELRFWQAALQSCTQKYQKPRDIQDCKTGCESHIKYETIEINYLLKRKQKLLSKIKEFISMETYLDIIVENIITEAGFKHMPHGWDRGSVKKFGTTLGKGYKDLANKKSIEPEEKGFFERCVARMRGKVKNPEGFCASVKDEASGSTYWRGKGKTPQKAARMVAKHQNV